MSRDTKTIKIAQGQRDIANPREDKGDREGIPHTHPIRPIGNSSRVIFRTTDSKGD